MADEKPDITSLAIPTATYVRFRSFCEPRHLILRHVAAGILEWFMRQPPAVQSVVQGIHDGMDLAYADALEEMAKAIRNPTAQNAAKFMRHMAVIRRSDNEIDPALPDEAPRITRIEKPSTPSVGTSEAESKSRRSRR